MMVYLFYSAISLTLIIFQSTILSNFLFFDKLYDLLIPFILYLSLFRPFSEGILVSVFIGFVMDSISGGPFGLYITSYFWVFIGVRWVIQYLHAGSFVLLTFAVGIGVLVENIIFISTVAVIAPDWEFPKTVVTNLISQMLLAVFTGPFIISFFKQMHIKLDLWSDEQSTRKNG